MGIVALIPVKSLDHGKSRLAESLDLAHRIQLTEETLRRLLHVLRGERRITRIVVVTSDARVVAWLSGRGADVVIESGSGLNEALTEARADIGACEALLVLPADVAAVSPHDVAGLLDAAQSMHGDCVVIAPDRHGHGTNALLLRPPGVIDFAFGANSRQLHTDAARRVEAHVREFFSDSLALDLDLPEDVELYSRQW